METMIADAVLDPKELGESNFTRWMERYTVELRNAVEKYPAEYGWPIANVPVVAGRMAQGFRDGSYNKDGRAIKACCKHFGIKHTYGAINTFLKG